MNIGTVQGAVATWLHPEARTRRRPGRYRSLYRTGVQHSERPGRYRSLYRTGVQCSETTRSLPLPVPYRRSTLGTTRSLPLPVPYRRSMLGDDQVATAPCTVPAFNTRSRLGRYRFPYRTAQSLARVTGPYVLGTVQGAVATWLHREARTRNRRSTLGDDQVATAPCTVPAFNARRRPDRYRSPYSTAQSLARVTGLWVLPARTPNEAPSRHLHLCGKTLLPDRILNVKRLSVRAVSCVRL